MTLKQLVPPEPHSSSSVSRSASSISSSSFSITTSSSSPRSSLPHPPFLIRPPLPLHNFSFLLSRHLFFIVKKRSLLLPAFVSSGDCLSLPQLLVVVSVGPLSSFISMSPTVYVFPCRFLCLFPRLRTFPRPVCLAHLLSFLSFHLLFLLRLSLSVRIQF